MYSITRRKFIRQVSILAPILLVGIGSCKPTPALSAFQNLKFPNIKLNNEKAYDLDTLIIDLKYTGYENENELLDKILNNIKQDFKEEKTAFSQGWLVSRTEIVLSNIELND